MAVFGDWGLRVSQPVVEPGVADLRVIAGEEGALADRDAVVGRVRVGDHLARIVARGERVADELVEAELLGARDLRNPVQRRGDRDPGDCARDVIGGHRLDQHWREPNRVAVGRLVGDAVHELEELRRVDD